MPWEGFFNTRDLDGLPTRSGRRTAHGAFFRSADPRFVTDRGAGRDRTGLIALLLLAPQHMPPS